MLKRPLHPRFGPAVQEGRKVTTIRDAPWPLGRPIMLYHWAGAPYRSKHLDVAPILVESARALQIVMPADGDPIYYPRPISGRTLWSCEGFTSQADMDAWFRQVVPAGQSSTKSLMRFRLWNPDYAGL